MTCFYRYTLVISHLARGNSWPGPCISGGGVTSD